MDNSKTRKPRKSQLSEDKAKIKESASDLLNESKKFANDLYRESLRSVNQKATEVEGTMEEYSDNLVKKIRTNPISSVLIAAGVGVVLSALFRK